MTTAFSTVFKSDYWKMPNFSEGFLREISFNRDMHVLVPDLRLTRAVTGSTKTRIVPTARHWDAQCAEDLEGDLGRYPTPNPRTIHASGSLGVPAERRRATKKVRGFSSFAGLNSTEPSRFWRHYAKWLEEIKLTF